MILMAKYPGRGHPLDSSETAETCPPRAWSRSWETTLPQNTTAPEIVDCLKSGRTRLWLSKPD